MCKQFPELCFVQQSDSAMIDARLQSGILLAELLERLIVGPNHNHVQLGGQRILDAATGLLEQLMRFAFRKATQSAEQ
jgi:hypothetical protein